VTTHRFKSLFVRVGTSGSAVEVPRAISEAIGKRGQVRVRGTLNGVDFKSNLMPMGDGSHCLGVHKATQVAAGIDFGDNVSVEMEEDSAPRAVEVPLGLAQALKGEPRTKAFFDELAHTHRREYANWVAEAKRPETRQRRIEQTMAFLRDGRRSR
jgi:Bacteriocin-protection, YdeI or OmpD-Associated/Domain of unknown function (DUF1905)